MRTETRTQTADELREKVAASCRILAQHGLVKGSTGHVSTRTPGSDTILIRGRPDVDRGLRFAAPESIIEVDLDGRPVGGAKGVRRIGEIYIHTEMYRQRPGVNAVIHAHPPGVLLCTMTGLKIRPIFGGYEPPGMRMAMDGLPLFERSITLHTLEETLPMLELMGNKDVCLMRAHGIAVAGRTVEEATSRAVTLEALARLNYYASLRGVDVPEISDEDQEEWNRRARVDEEERQAGGPEVVHDGNWNYYTALLDEVNGQVDPTGLGFGFR